MTFIQAAEIVLKQNGDVPMTEKQIWKVMDSLKLCTTIGKTPWLTLGTKLSAYSDNCGFNQNVILAHNSQLVYKFHIHSTNPATYVLYVASNNVVSTPVVSKPHLACGEEFRIGL